ncbi:MAG: hypothetical protein DIKNOCCD_02828 [bacterium]|nr:hypothetical protein [bacterium]
MGEAQIFFRWGVLEKECACCIACSFQAPSRFFPGPRKLEIQGIPAAEILPDMFPGGFHLAGFDTEDFGRPCPLEPKSHRNFIGLRTQRHFKEEYIKIIIQCEEMAVVDPEEGGPIEFMQADLQDCSCGSFPGPDPHEDPCTGIDQISFVRIPTIHPTIPARIQTSHPEDFPAALLNEIERSLAPC